mgnify:CR=1 FL=1
MQRGCARMTKKNKRNSKNKKMNKRTTRSSSNRKNRKSQRHRHQKGGVLYTFDNNDMIAGLPAVKAISNCPPGVSATDPEWGVKMYEKFKSQKGGMNRDGLRWDVQGQFTE